MMKMQYLRSKDGCLGSCKEFNAATYRAQETCSRPVQIPWRSLPARAGGWATRQEPSLHPPAGETWAHASPHCDSLTHDSDALGT